MSFERRVESVLGRPASVKVDVVVVRADAEVGLGRAVGHAFDPLLGMAQCRHDVIEVVALLEGNRSD